MPALFRIALKTTFAIGICAAAASAATVFDTGSTALVPQDFSQLGRLSRNSVISDWSTSKPFPGEINPSVAYHYHAYDIPIPSYYPFVQITIDDTSGAALVFASAYSGSYTPNGGLPNGGLDIHYLGDAGGSGNLFGTDPRAFQIVMPSAADLIVVINDASATGAGVGKTFDVLVEGFTDTSFDDQVPTPEPVTLSLAGGGLLALAFFRRRRTVR